MPGVIVRARSVWRGQRIGVVVPLFNEAPLARATLAGIPDFVDRVYLVDDASVDGTDRVLRALASSRIVRVRHRKNRGVGAAIVSGYYRAIDEGIELIAVMAGDNQMAPEDLEGLLAASPGFDYIKGNRFLHASRSRMPRTRRLGSWFLSWLTRRTTGLTVDDCQCGYTVLRASSAHELPLDDLWPRYGYPNDLLALLSRLPALVSEVPVHAVYGPEKSGLHPGHVVSIAWRILRRGRQLRRNRQAPPDQQPLAAAQRSVPGTS